MIGLDVFHDPLDSFKFPKESDEAAQWRRQPGSSPGSVDRDLHMSVIETLGQNINRFSLFGTRLLFPGQELYSYKV